MPKVEIQTAPGDTGALMVALAVLATDVAKALTRPRFNKDQAGAFLMGIASQLRTAAEGGFLERESAMKIVNGLETSAEIHFEVKPRQ